MRELDQENLDCAIALGDAVCRELGICCGQRGQVIFRIYKKLEEMRAKKETATDSESSETQA